MTEFQEFPKIPRLSREVIVTEKIDGTNAQVYIDYHSLMGDPATWMPFSVAEQGGLVMLAGSRTRYVTPQADNHGWASWVKAHADELFALGPGRYFGEWWGSGIQRGYGLTKGDKRFSLFNVARWADVRDEIKYPAARPACCGVVPVLYTGMFDDFMRRTEFIMDALRGGGSVAAPGFADPEGIVIFHTQSGLSFKKTLAKDAEHKGKA